MVMRLTHDSKFDQSKTETKKTYIIFSSGRTGTTWLALGLYKLGLGIPLEYFNITQRKGFSERINVPYTFHDEESFVSYIQDILSLRTTPNGVFGASIHIYQWMTLFQKMPYMLKGQARVDFLIQKLQDSFPNPHFVFLYRQDLLMQAISMVIARQTDSWSSALDELKEPKYDYNQIKNTLERVVHGVGLCKYFQETITAPQCTFLYEDLEHNYDDMIHQVVEMLDVHIDISPDISKQTIKKQRTNRNQMWKERFLKEHHAR